MFNSLSTVVRRLIVIGAVVVAFVAALIWPFLFFAYGCLLALGGALPAGMAAYDWIERGDEDLALERARQRAEKALL